MQENTNILNKIIDGLYGFSTADALGVPVEFSTRGLRESDPVTEMRGNGTYNVPEGTWSDDTSMTIATMDSIRESEGINYEDIMDKYCDWIFNNKYCATDVVFDVGGTTGKAIDNYYKNNMKPIECGGRDDFSNGNGSLMRMLPIVYYLHYSNLDDNTKDEIINNYSSLTHSHEVSRLGCRIYYDYMDGLLSGLSIEEAYDRLKYEDYKGKYSEDSISKYIRVLDGSLSNCSIDTIKSTGYVVDTLEAALWCSINTNSYEEAVTCAVNLGDDTDTIGAITGSITGTVYGVENIPDRWLSKVRKLDELKSIATGYSNVVCKNNEAISQRYQDNLSVSYDEDLYRILNGLENSDNSEKKTNVL